MLTDSPAQVLEQARALLARNDASAAENLCLGVIEDCARDAEAWYVLGLARQQQGQRGPALDAFSKAVSLDRRAARYHYALGNALLDDGRIDRAISSFRRALRIEDGLAEVHNDLGAAYFEKGWYPEAEACFRKAIERKPDHGVAWSNLGACLRRLGRLLEARRAYQRALSLRIRALLPPFLRWKLPAEPQRTVPSVTAPRVEVERLSAMLGAGRARDALPEARALMERFPEDPDAHYLLASALHDMGEHAEGAQRIGAAISRREDRAEYHILAARLHAALGEPDTARVFAARAVSLEPGSAAVYATLAAVYHPWREDLAVEAARKAIGLDPNLDAAHGNLAAALWGMGRLEEAERANRTALQLNPKNLNYRVNHALILKDLGRVEEARAIYRELQATSGDTSKVCTDLGTIALEVDGDRAEARRLFRLGQSLSGSHKPKMFETLLDLLEGDFASGWERYEVRRSSPDQRFHHALFRFPEWDGGPVAAGRLLVYGEQGLGDEIMFASMFADLARRVPNVTAMCDSRLGALFARSFPAMEVVSAPRDGWRQAIAGLSGISCQVAAGSLGRHFRRASGDFPGHQGYLQADPAKVAAWRERLAALGEGLRVGISWQGGLQRTGRSRRSLSLGQLLEILGLPRTHWVSLQYTDSAAQIAAFHDAHGIAIHAYPDVTKDMDDLAGLICALDLVVSVCNTNVHLTGALGRSALVLAPFVPEWRYGIAGERMLWYPAVRIIRQKAYEDWRGVIAAVRAEVSKRASP